MALDAGSIWCASSHSVLFNALSTGVTSMAFYEGRSIVLLGDFVSSNCFSFRFL